VQDEERFLMGCGADFVKSGDGLLVLSTQVDDNRTLIVSQHLTGEENPVPHRIQPDPNKPLS
jgi:hypothetical protein